MPEMDSSTPPRHRLRAPSQSRLRRTLALLLVFLMAFATTAGALGYARLQGNIDRHNLDDLLGTDRPTGPDTGAGAGAGAGAENQEDAHAGETLNLLFMGTDSRVGENAEIDGSSGMEGMRADTTLIVQIPADRTSLTVVSIPRDTLVDIPSCTRPDGSESAAQSQAMFNSAFQTGSAGTSIAHGAACTIRTVEALTGIYIDDFVVVDFAGFINLIDALGGVPMYVDEEIDSREADLQLQPGCQILDGEDALGFARVRKGVGDGSDISRIGRQQELLLAIIEDALSSRVLGDPVRLYQVADAATQTITTGTWIGSLAEIVGLASSMVNLNLDEVLFLTMPFDWAGDRVVPNATYSQELWRSLRLNDEVDPRLSGPGWEIAERIAADEAAAEAESDAASDGATDEPTLDAPGPTIEPSDEATEPPACTRETASQ